MSPAFRSTSTPCLVLSFSIASDALEEWNARAFRIANANARHVLAGQWLILRFATLRCRSGRNCRSRTGSKERRLLLDRPVTVFTRNLDRGAWLVVEIPVAV